MRWRPMSAAAPLPASPTALVFRHVLQARLEALFPPGLQVAALGDDDGEGAFLPPRGVRVFRVPRLHDLPAAGTTFGGAYWVSGLLSAADLSGAGIALAAALRPGAPVL